MEILKGSGLFRYEWLQSEIQHMESNSTGNSFICTFKLVYHNFPIEIHILFVIKKIAAMSNNNQCNIFFGIKIYITFKQYFANK